MTTIKIPPLKNLEESMWDRHANPNSSFTRIGLFFVFLFALWAHSPLWIFISVMAILTNPWWFPPPKDQSHWFTLAVKGERIWLERAHPTQKIVLVSIGTMLFLVLVTAVWTHHLFLSVFFTLINISLKLVFLMFTANIAQNQPVTLKPHKTPENTHVE